MREIEYSMTSASGTTPRWLKSLVVTTTKLRELGSLQPGWHYGDGVRISQNLITKAITVAQKAVSFGFFESNAFPGVDGGILVTVYKGNCTFEIRLFPDGRAGFVKEVDDEDVAFFENVTVERAIELLKGEAALLCLSGQFIPDTTMNLGNASEVRLLKLPQTAEYPFLTRNVLKQEQGLFASIFNSFTGELRVTLQSSGSFVPIVSRMD